MKIIWINEISFKKEVKRLLLLMKITLIILFICIFQLQAVTSYGQTAVLSVETKEVALEEVFKEIEEQSEFLFNYRDSDINHIKARVNIKNGTIKEILTQALRNTDLSFSINDRHVTIYKASKEVKEAKKVITGNVKDNRGELLLGVSIVIKGTSTGTVTDIDGNYSIEVPDEHAVLVFNYLGYSVKELSVEGKSRLDVILTEDSQNLDEIVVVGYGTQKKVNLSGAIGTASSKMLENRPVANVGQALQGAVGNLTITSSSGQANTAPEFNIRGKNSITGGEPLILIDNVPVTADEFSRMNAQDIDNISVLKDASSAAIYGARASFGVILVTTKRGNGDKVKINYSGNLTINNMTNTPELEYDPYIVAEWKNTSGKGWYNFFDEESLAYAKRRSEDPSLPVAYLSSAKPETWQYFGSTNWFEEVYKKNSVGHSHNLNLSGSTPKLHYYFSAEYYNNNGVLKVGSDKYNRYNLRNKIDYKVTDWLEFGTNIAYTYYTNDQPYNFDAQFFHNLNRTSTLDVPRNEDGTWTDRGAGILGRLEEGGRSVTKSGNFQGTFSLTLNLIKDVLTIKGNATYKKKNLRNHKWDVPIWAKTGPDSEPTLTTHDPFTVNPFSEKYNIAEDYAVYDVYTNFNKTFVEDHSINAVVGFNQEEYTYEKFLSGRDKLISPSLPSHQLATGEKVVSESIESWALRGAFYRLNYIYKNKYIIETNGRYDGSSRFPKNDRFGFFPSVSGGWVISEENFFKPLHSVVDFLKIRASYGALGNQNVSAYEYIPSMEAKALDFLLDGEYKVGAYAPGLVSSSLTWEKVKTINGGIDLNLLSNRLTASFDIYRRDTEGMLTKSETLPNVLGADEPKCNAADMKTSGWEFSLVWRDNFILKGNPFNYSVRAILSDNHSVITKYDNPIRSLSDYYVGQTLGEIWGLTTLGFFQSQEEIDNHADQNQVASFPGARSIQPGDLKFADLNGDKYVNSGKWTVDDPGDYKVIGNTTPRYNYGLDLSADWNNFDFRAFFQGVGKKDWYPGANNHYFWGMYCQVSTTVLKSNMDHWTPENPDAYFPRPKSFIAEVEKELGAPQTKYLQSAAYCRLKNMTVGYTLPKSLIAKTGISNLRFYFSGENIFTIKSLPKQFDPEGLGQNLYPFYRSFSFGVNLSL